MDDLQQWSTHESAAVTIHKFYIVANHSNEFLGVEQDESECFYPFLKLRYLLVKFQPKNL